MHACVCTALVCVEHPADLTASTQSGSGHTPRCPSLSDIKGRVGELILSCSETGQVCVSRNSERVHPHPSRSTQLIENCFLGSPSIQEAAILSSPVRRGSGILYSSVCELRARHHRYGCSLRVYLQAHGQEYFGRTYAEVAWRCSLVLSSVSSLSCLPPVILCHCP